MARKSSTRRDGTDTTRRRPQVEPDRAEPIVPTRPPSAGQRWLPIAVTAAAAFLAYLPSIDNGFVTWDDDHYIFKNHQLHYDDGIKSIWFDVFKHTDAKFKPTGREDRVSHQYYPLVFTLYWLEFRFHKWFNDADPSKTIEQNIEDEKMTAASFHVVSMVLHAVNTMLLIFCFRALGISNWVAWAATLLFAVHPMQVATVAWAAERKNIISLMFYLLSMLSYIKMRRDGKWWRYLLSLVLFQAALFSKTVALTLPVMLFFTDRLLEGQWRLKPVAYSILRVVPFAVLSSIAAWTTINVEDRERTIPITSEQRPFIPCASLLFYVFKMLLPVGLSPVYPLWQPDPAELKWYLPILGVSVIAVALIVFRRRLGRHFIWATLLYVVFTGPMLGFKNINYFQFAFVADHYFYHGSVGLFLALAIGIDLLRSRISSSRLSLAAATGVVAAAALAYGTWTFVYCETWQTPESFWARTLKMNDACWPAYYNTANAFVRAAGEERDPEKRNALYEEAVERYIRVTEIHHRISQPFEQWIKVRIAQKKWPEALDAAEAAVARFPHVLEFQEYAGMFARKVGETQKSIKHYVTAADIARLKADAAMRKRNPCSASRHYEKAGQYLNAAYKQDEDNKELHKRLAEILEKLNDAKVLCGTA